MDKLSQIFGALSDPVRLRILALIMKETELCVCELVGALEMSQPKISRHCKALNEAGLVTSRREAQWVLYSIADALPDWSQKAIDAAVQGVRLDPHYRADCERLEKVERPPVRCDLEENEAC